MSVALLASMVLLPVRAMLLPPSIFGGTADTPATAGSAPGSAANQPPVLLANNPMVLDQGAAAVVTADLLAAADAESPPGQVTFTIGEAIVRSGQLQLNGTTLVAGSTFAQADINEGRLVYHHDDSTNTYDDFTFTVSDPDGGVIPGPPYFSYTFKIYVNLVNHAPVAGPGNGATGYGVPFHGTLPATDRDEPAQTLHYRILTNGVIGTAVLTDTNTGAFVYTPNPGERGADTITFQVNDGALDSAEPGRFTITMKPLALSQSYAVLESAPCAGRLAATNAIPPHTLVYRIVTNGALGTVILTDTNTGAFTYHPTPGTAGRDAFSFAVNDGFADSEPAACTVSIQPIIEPGDFFVTGGQGGLLFYVDRRTSVPAIVAAGQNLVVPKACALGRDGNVIVLNGGSGVVRVNPIDGTQTVLSPATNFSAEFLGAMGVAVERSGTILVADGPNGLVRVAPDTGAVTPLAQGGNLVQTVGVAVAANGDIFVTDASAFADSNQLSRVVRVDPATGAQTVISAGTNLVFPVGIVVEGPDTLVVGDAAGLVGGRNLIVRIEVATGAQSIVSEGGNLALPVGLGLDDFGTIVVVSQGRGEVVAVDPLTGDQAVIASGPASANLLGLAVARAADLPDSDGNGLPDWWEQRCFPYEGAQPDDDPDQDGLDNAGEFKAGTNPTDPGSVLKLTLRSAPGEGAILEWSSVTNRLYTLERSPVLSTGPEAFAPFSTGIRATPPLNRLTVPWTDPGGEYFYRLRLEE